MGAPGELAGAQAGDSTVTEVQEARQARLAGQPLARREDARILRGRTRYLDDIDPPGALHAAFVRSQHAHARITGIEAPDSVTLLTGADMGGAARPLPVIPVEGVELADEPHPLLAGEEVRYVGQ